jgi:hypothetical protein
MESSEKEPTLTSPPRITAYSLPSNAGRLGVARAQLAELEREVDLYLAFWIQARDGCCELSLHGEQA